MVGLFFNRIVESGRLADDPVVITIKPGKHPYLTLGLRNEYGRPRKMGFYSARNIAFSLGRHWLFAFFPIWEEKGY